jgi:hypothetical protein
MRLRSTCTVAVALSACSVLALGSPATAQDIGREVAVPVHLQNGEEFSLSARKLIAHGATLFSAVWTVQEGGGSGALGCEHPARFSS